VNLKRFVLCWVAACSPVRLVLVVYFVKLLFITLLEQVINVLNCWRLKEQLIRELVKTGQEAQKINAENAARIDALEEEKALANSDLAKLQKTLEELMARENTDKQQKDQLLM